MLSRRYFVGFITNHFNCFSSHTNSPWWKKEQKPPKKEHVWKYKKKERWKQNSNFHHNVENFHQFGPVIRTKWMDARKVPKNQSQCRRENVQYQRTPNHHVIIEDQNPKEEH